MGTENARETPLETLRRMAVESPGQRLDARAFARALGLRGAWTAGVMLRHFDRDRDGHVTASEVAAELDAIARGDDARRLHFLFDLFDQDGNGSIDPQELERLLSIGLAENGVELSPRWIEDMARAVFSDADLDRDGRITFQEFWVSVGRVRALRAMTSRAPALWLTRQTRPPELSRSTVWMTEHRESVVGLGAYAFANVAAFVWAAVEWYGRGADAWLIVARGFGRGLDLNLLLLLLPTLRSTFNALRRTWVGRVVPLDNPVGMHRVMGHTVGWLSLGHGAAHVIRNAVQGRDASVYVTNLAMGTGVLLTLVGVLIWVFALPFVRRSQRFELFWVAHRAYLPWLALAVLHTPRTWPWMALPLALLAVERVSRSMRKVRATRALALEPLVSGVTRVTIARPAGFAFRAGDYVFLRVPLVARGEWHPFTISSAPEREGVFTLHVRSLGNWTRALHEYAGERARTGARLPLEVEVDGPYGTPTAHIFSARVPVLVGAGIGVTPFASILESLLFRTRLAQGGRLPIERVYFVWVARDQFAFEWFASLLGEIERSEVASRFEFIIHMTAGRTDATTEGLALALDLVYARTNADAVTGLKSRTRFGAPAWDSLLGEVAAQHPGVRPEVFFCGPDALAAQVAHAAAGQGMAFHQEHF